MSTGEKRTKRGSPKMAALPRKRLQHDDFPQHVSCKEVLHDTRVCGNNVDVPTLRVSPVDPTKFVCAALIDAMGRWRGPRALPWSCSAITAGCHVDPHSLCQCQCKHPKSEGHLAHLACSTTASGHVGYETSRLRERLSRCQRFGAVALSPVMLPVCAV